jgi:drug/metabolite transporter (DMT)-like permease
MIMKNNGKIKAHFAASFCIIVWSITFISTKILLEDFTPTEILFFRFILAYIMLFFLSPRLLIPKEIKEELLFALAGLCGVTIYFLFQNIGLTYTLAANAGVLVSVAPMFTAIIAHFLVPGVKLQMNFIIGFIMAVTGIFLINFNGSFLLQLNPLGDILIILAALAWAFYCNLLISVNKKGYGLIESTRKIFFYGLVFMIPALLFMDFEWNLSRFTDSLNLLNTLFLGIVASGLCFLTWNYAVGVLGSVKTSIYLYLIPIVTIIFSALILHEPITLICLAGTALILAGLAISEKKAR